MKKYILLSFLFSVFISKIYSQTQPSEFCTTLQKAISIAQGDAFSLKELMAEPNSTGPVFKNSQGDSYWYNSKLQMPDSKQTVLAKGIDKITFKAVMNLYKFEYMVRPGYTEVMQKVENCINELQVHVSKEKNGPQNTFYIGDHFTIGVRWFTRNDEFIVYLEIYHS